MNNNNNNNDYEVLVAREGGETQIPAILPRVLRDGRIRVPRHNPLMKVWFWDDIRIILGWIEMLRQRKKTTLTRSAYNYYRSALAAAVSEYLYALPGSKIIKNRWNLDTPIPSKYSQRLIPLGVGGTLATQRIATQIACRGYNNRKSYN